MVSTHESVQGQERKAWNLFKPWYFRIYTLGWLMRILFFHSFLFFLVFLKLVLDIAKLSFEGYANAFEHKK